ncbi:MAG: succinate--CoA ligase subunit beta [Cyanobacteria bacterium CRU_2_1]|nr:succinate--CoA ligase subunit beta [Cyanobacteria bacterium RU_5_0]NJR58924.1 succinate--CoA ligase subunit beta [Cyanobacteria bacterium CRU_2_1]
MDLLEYQAKELFRQIGIPVLPSQRINSPRDLKELRIPYPIALKSQVSTSGRKKAGGIKFVENTIDAVAAARSIFHLSIMGKYPDVLLAEAKYNAEREFYLAVVLDGSTRRPLLLGSQSGGEEIESRLDQMHHVIVDQEFSPFYARRLTLKMGLEGSLIQSISVIIEKMYRLFIQQDLDLIEINPLAVSATGELMALDGKVIINDAALGRHLSLLELIGSLPNPISKPIDSSFDPVGDRLSPTCGLNLIGLDGNIGVLCNGAGLTMATLDLLYKAKGKPAGFIDLGGEYRYYCPSNTLEERIEQGLELIAHDRRIKAILVNILGGSISCLHVAKAIAAYLKRQLPNHPSPMLIVRLVGDQLTQAQQLLTPSEVTIFDQLDEAIVQTVAFAKGAK